MANWIMTACIIASTFIRAFAYVDPVTPPTPQPDVVEQSAIDPKFYLPFVAKPPPALAPMRAIWVDQNDPPDRDFVFFRKTITTQSDVESPQLHIFADTRYVLWMDGELVGRGPARFSRGIQEYDVYHLGSLQSGQHVIAVLVQWAPTIRRSVSTRPGLYARLIDDHWRVLASTDATWKALRSDAWRSNSAKVHAWDMIGPTEVLDYSRLPQGWQSIDFDDQDWGAAVPVDRPMGSGEQRPRSISLLENVQMPVSVFDSGLLSPGAKFGELLPKEQFPYQISFDPSSAGQVTIEVVSISGTPPADRITASTGQLTWTPAGTDRPDVYQATISVPPAPSSISINNVPSDGLSFDLQSTSLPIPDLPFDPGIQPGRKLLLANPVSDPGAVSTVNGADSMNVEFSSQPSYLVLDAGRTIHGRLEADVSGPLGTIVDIGWDERLLDGRRPLPYPGSLHDGLWDQTDSWILDGETHKLTTVDTRTGRYILIAVWGNGPVQFGNLRVYENRYPVEARGSFSSDDALLNQIWQTGVNTLYPSMLDGYVDPWRERGQWWGDAYVSDHTNRVAFGDSKLLRRGLVFMDEPIALTGVPSGVAPSVGSPPMLDYAMLWVHSLQEYVQRTGDYQLLAACYSQVKQLANYLAGYQSSQGLLDIPEGSWGSTDYLDSMAYYDRWGLSTAVNSMYYETLQRAAWLADTAGHPEDAQAFRSQASAVKQAINDRLYDPANHDYVATILSGNKTIPASIYAQAFALAYGVVPDGEIDAVVGSMLEMIPTSYDAAKTGTYAMYWILEALGKSGHISEALDLIRIYYGGMLDQGATTWWENFEAIHNYRSSLSHAWSSSPTWFLTTYLLGARTDDGLAWVVQPALGGVSSASGKLPLRSSELSVSWQLEESGGAAVNLDSPFGSWGMLNYPLCASDLTITLDGATIWENGTAVIPGLVPISNTLQIPLDSGPHNLTFNRACSR